MSGTRIYPYGSATINVKATKVLTVFSRTGNTTVWQQVGFPNYPNSWTLLATVANGTYVSAAFSAAANVRIDAGPDGAVYDFSAAAGAADLQCDLVGTKDPFVMSGFTGVDGVAAADNGTTGGGSSIAGGAGGAGGSGTGNGGNGGDVTLASGAGGATTGGTAGRAGVVRVGSTFVRKLTRSTITNAATVTVAQVRTGILYQDASGGNVTMTSPTGTALDTEFPTLATGESMDIFCASNHASNTSTISGGTGVTLVGSGAVTQTGGSFKLIRTGTATYDLVRVA
jgi:hypothetical protein